MMQHSWDATLLTAVALIAALDGSSQSLTRQGTVIAAPVNNITVSQPVNSCAVPNSRRDTEVQDPTRRPDAARCEVKGKSISLDGKANR